MTDRQESPDVPRVVVLTRRAVLPEALGDVAEPVAVTTGYEAAAELHAAPAAALVVDLPLIGRRHLPLMHLARRMGVELYGVGELPVGPSAEDLAGMRLTSLGELPRELARRTGAPVCAGTPSGEGSYEPEPAPPAEGIYDPEPPAGPPATGAPACPETTEATEPPEAPDKPPSEARDLLTPEELAALLEDRP
ncbi:MAG: hypothetical protein ACOC8F_02825 [Planctomycetota bacterium]